MILLYNLTFIWAWKFLWGEFFVSFEVMWKANDQVSKRHFLKVKKSKSSLSYLLSQYFLLCDVQRETLHAYSNFCLNLKIANVIWLKKLAANFVKFSKHLGYFNASLRSQTFLNRNRRQTKIIMLCQRNFPVSFFYYIISTMIVVLIWAMNGVDNEKFQNKIINLK